MTLRFDFFQLGYANTQNETSVHKHGIPICRKTYVFSLNFK